MDEDQLIIHFQAGEEKAFKHIFDMFNNRLIFFTRGIVEDPDSAEDLVQDAFVKLWDKRLNFKDLISIKAFLYISLKNVSRNLFKHDKVKQKYQSLLAEAIDDDPIILKIVEAEVLEEVNKAIKELPEGCRNVINLSYFEGLSNQEVADQLNISINTVKTQKMRGLRALRNLLKEMAPALIILISKLN